MCTLLQWNTFCLVETLWAIVNPEVNLDDNLTYCTFSFNASITPSVMHKNEKRSLRCWLCSFSGCIILDTCGGKKLCPEYIGAVCQENPFSSFPICRTGTRWMLDKSVLRKHGLWIKLFQINMVCGLVLGLILVLWSMRMFLWRPKQYLIYAIY